MCPENDFLPFCPTDTGLNLMTQADYSVATNRSIGNQPGIASSKLVNKAVRQSTFIAAQLAQFVANRTGSNVLDDGNATTFLNLLSTALLQAPPSPTIQKFTSGSGTYNRSYVFVIGSGNATVGATYTNNGITYTVSATVSAATQVVMTGSGSPLTSGTLTKASGTGDATLTFSQVYAPQYIKVKMVGGGGGGGGSSTAAGNNAGNGGNGGNTTFGTTLLVANGGTGGSGTTGAAVGGTASLGTGPVGIALSGGTGQDRQQSVAGGVGLMGAAGASTPFGGPGSANTGAGGYAATISNSTANISNAGGGAGGYVDAIIYNPSATYSYAVGAAGTAGAAGTSGVAGQAGSAGMIIVEEHFSG